MRGILYRVLVVCSVLILIAGVRVMAGEKTDKKANSEFRFVPPPTLVESPGWQRARELKGVQKLTAVAVDGGWTLATREVLADIDATYIVVEVKEKKGLWEFNDASLVDEQGRTYAYRGCHRDCGIVKFAPLNDNPGNLTLTIRKLGLVRDADTMRVGFGLSASGGDANDYMATFPQDVKEKLARWGLLEKETEESPPAEEKESPSWKDDYYMEELKGHWTLQFPVSTAPRQKCASVRNLDTKIPLFNAFLMLKKLIKGLHEWVIEYDIVDEKGKNEGAIAQEEYREKIIALIRESSTREEMMAKSEKMNDPLSSQRKLPRCRFNVRCGNKIFEKWHFELRDNNRDDGGSSLTFTPQDNDSSITVIILGVENICPLEPYRFELDISQAQKGMKIPFCVDFATGHHEGALCIHQVRRDFNQESLVNDEGEFLRKHLPVEEAEHTIDHYRSRRTRIDYHIDTIPGEKLFFDAVDMEVRDSLGILYSNITTEGASFKAKNDLWEDNIQIWGLPEETGKISMKVNRFHVTYYHGSPPEIPIQ